jgi:hypothetical protein
MSFQPLVLIQERCEPLPMLRYKVAHLRTTRVSKEEWGGRGRRDIPLPGAERSAEDSHRAGHSVRGRGSSHLDVSEHERLNALGEKRDELERDSPPTVGAAYSSILVS